MKINKIHKEGRWILATTLTLLLIINFLTRIVLDGYLSAGFQNFVAGISIITFLFVLYFFRDPQINIAIDDNNCVLAPADGKVVVIEQVQETEYFQDKRIQVSIFMSPTNVHVNRSPISGVVKYTKYHPGNYMVAWHPKSSTLNERFTSVIECPENDIEVLVRQIAGKVARKIKNYLDEGEEINQGEQLGFIKFGSRVDIFLPLNAKINVNLKEKVKGGRTVLAYLD